MGPSQFSWPKSVATAVLAGVILYGLILLGSRWVPLDAHAAFGRDCRHWEVAALYHAGIDPSDYELTAAVDQPLDGPESVRASPVPKGWEPISGLGMGGGGAYVLLRRCKVR